MAPRDLQGDEYDNESSEPDIRDEDHSVEEPRQRRSRRWGVLFGMLWGIILIGGGLVVLNEVVPHRGSGTPAVTATQAPVLRAAGQEGAEAGDGSRAALRHRERTAGPVDPTPGGEAPIPDERVAIAPDAGRDALAAGTALAGAAVETGADPVDDAHRATDPPDPPDPAPEISLGSPGIGELRGTYIPVAGPAIEVNARPAALPKDAGLLAVVLYGGTGSAWLTRAMDGVSIPLTLAVRADQPEQVLLARGARERGHEILAELPLVTDDGDASAELTGWESAEEVEVRIADILVALNMAVGAVAPDGARMLYDVEAMATLLKPIAAHSFLWVEPRTSDRSAAARMAAGSSLILLQGNVFVGPGEGADGVYAAMERAAGEARRQGTSVIFVPATPEGMRALVKWGFERTATDVVLAPISAIVRKRGKG